MMRALGIGLRIDEFWASTPRMLVALISAQDVMQSAMLSYDSKQWE